MTLRSGTCPHCDEHNIREKSLINNSLCIDDGGVRDPRFASLKILVCVNCGYVEQYVVGTENVEYISEHWDKHEIRKKKKHEE